jgi:hypothetical protein
MFDARLNKTVVNHLRARFAYELVPSNLDETESHITAHTILLA